jgi:hypothetical protein
VVGDKIGKHNSLLQKYRARKLLLRPKYTGSLLWNIKQ